MASQKIDVAFLRRYIDQALDVLEGKFPGGVPLRRPLYWEIPISRQFDTKNPAFPPEPAIGDLKDDLEFLELALKSGGQVLPATLIHAVGLLNYVAAHSQEASDG